MFRVFEGRTADEVWQKIALTFREGDGITTQTSRAGENLEILHSAISINCPTQRWVTSRYPPINPAFAIAEVVWVMTGRNDSAFLNYFNRQLPKFAGHGACYHGAYGYRLRQHLGFDQLDRAYQALKEKPDSRQIVLQIWDGKIDMPNATGKEAAPDIPCNVISILKVRAGKLEWMQVLRSNDLYRGLPYNFIQFTSLQEVMAGWLKLKVGSYNQISNSLHVYHSDLESILKFSPGDPLENPDSIAFPKEESEEYFKEIERKVEVIINQNKSADTLTSLVRESLLPTSFRNMLSVLCAEGARRRRQIKAANEIMNYCTNPLYSQLFDRWITSR
jgi:thymidylate synthase